TEAENLVAEKEGRLCVRYYKRTDGKVLTSDCPVGLRGVRRKIALRLSMTVALAFSLWSFVLGRGWIPGATMGDMAETSNGRQQDQPGLVCKVLNKIDPPPTMGAPPPFAAYASPPPPHLMGRISIAPVTGKFPSNNLGNSKPPSTAKKPTLAPEKTVKAGNTEPNLSHLHQIKTD
ncbi:MAG: hypothetical protein M3Y56_05670, partial [Armatimonadota bacterium]|nr:hypothetical protein [Armatimonadota bacterium]